MQKHNDNIQSETRAQKHKARAFTLAETLLTVTIIGVIAALIVVPFSAKASERALETTKDIIEKDLMGTLYRMRLNEDLTGYKSTSEFVNTLKKYTKVVAVCSYRDVEKCFGYAKLKLLDNVDFSVKQLGQSYLWSLINAPSTSVAVKLAKGATGVMSYQKDCPWMTPIGQDETQTTQCLSIIYDVNGPRRPNKIGKDIVFVNAYLGSTLKTWAKGVKFEKGDLMSEGGLIFKCLASHTSGSRSNTRNPTVKSNKGSWMVVGTVDGEIPQYNATVRNAVGSQVQYNGNIYERTDYNLTGGQTPYSASSSRYWILVGKMDNTTP